MRAPGVELPDEPQHHVYARGSGLSLGQQAGVLVAAKNRYALEPLHEAVGACTTR